jgi:hypothetical protein
MFEQRTENIANLICELIKNRLRNAGQQHERNQVEILRIKLSEPEMVRALNDWGMVYHTSQHTLERLVRSYGEKENLLLVTRVLRVLQELLRYLYTNGCPEVAKELALILFDV